MARLSQAAVATVTQVVTQQVKIAPKLAERLLTSLRSYAGLKAQSKAIDKLLKEDRESVLRMGVETGSDKFELEGFKVKLVLDGTTKSLDKAKLLKLMVAAGLSVAKAQTVMEKATVESPTKPYPKITVPGVGGDED